MAQQEDIEKKLDELEDRRRLMKKQLEACEQQLEEIDEALLQLKNDQDQRVKEITDVI